MYYKYKDKIYTQEEIAGKTFHEESKPEPLFTLEEAEHCYTEGYRDGRGRIGLRGEIGKDEFFQQQFNITI